MIKRIARCACGQLSAECAGEPELVSACHCLECQRRTGSPFGVAAFFHQTSVIVRGEANTYARPSDSGFTVTHHFCPTCGSTVFWRPSRKPDHVAVALGAFADADFPAPSKSVYEQHKHTWLKLSL